MQVNTQTEIKQKSNPLRSLAHAIDWRFILLGGLVMAAAHTVMFDTIAPFGLSMIAACIKRKRWHVYTVLMHIIGCLFIPIAWFNVTPYITGSIILVLLMRMYEDMPVYIGAAITLTAVRLPLLLINGADFFSVAMLIIELCFCLMFIPIFTRFVNLLTYPSIKRHPDSDDILSLFTVMGIVVISTAEVTLPFNLNLSALLCAYLVMLMSMAGGFAFGGATGCILGMLSRLHLIPDPAAIGIYGTCGLVCGALRRLGKWGVISGFILTGSMFIIFAPLQIPLAFTIPEQITAGILLLITGGNMITFIENSIASCFPEPPYAARLKDAVNSRLVQASIALDKLSGYMRRINSTNDFSPSEDIFTVFDMAANKVCKNCINCLKCWQNEYDITAAALMDSSSFLSEMGYIEVDNFPSHFRNKCKKLDRFTEEVNKQYDNYKIQQVLNRKTAADEDMAARQIKDFSKIIEDINTRLTRELSFDTELEQRLCDTFSTLPVTLHTLNAIIDHKGRYEISITIPIRTNCTLEEIEAAVSVTIGKNMVISSITEAHNLATFHITEATPYIVNWGQASVAKEGQKICGDSKSAAQLNDGRIVLALSDGMGSGEMAARQSDTTIELLSKFFEAGFDAEATLRMINSILLLRSGAETFATVDIAIIDQYTAKCEFIKIGANCAYILNGNKVKQVRSGSLPAGILTEVDVEKTTLTLKPDSYVILISDGIESADDLWVAGYIKSLPPCTPQSMADSILKAAIAHHGGRNDDMTVITAEIKKEI